MIDPGVIVLPVLNQRCTEIVAGLVNLEEVAATQSMLIAAWLASPALGQRSVMAFTNQGNRRLIVVPFLSDQRLEC